MPCLAPCFVQKQHSVSVESHGSNYFGFINHILTKTTTTKCKHLPFASITHSWSVQVVVSCGSERSLSASLPPGVRPRGRRSCVTDGQTTGQTHLSLWPSNRLHFCFVGCIQLSLPPFPEMDDSGFCHRCRNRCHRAPGLINILKVKKGARIMRCLNPGRRKPGL